MNGESNTYIPPEYQINPVNFNEYKKDYIPNSIQEVPSLPKVDLSDYEWWNVGSQNSLPKIDLTTEQWWSDEIPSLPMPEQATKPETITHKVGAFVGKLLGKKLLKKEDIPSLDIKLGESKSLDFEITNMDKDWMQIMGYDQNDPQALEALSYYKKPKNAISIPQFNAHPKIIVGGLDDLPGALGTDDEKSAASDIGHSEDASFYAQPKVSLAELFAPTEAAPQSEPERIEVVITDFEVDEVSVRTAEQEVSLDDAVELLEKNRVVKDAPRVRDIAADGSRKNAIRHYRGYGGSAGASAPSPENEFILSEQESVAGLVGFLEAFVREKDSIKSNTYTMYQETVEELSATAADMLENLTYIGEKERTEAIKGIAASWKDRLMKNPKLQLCALAAISDSTTVKSDQFMLDGILAEFTDEELEQFSGRLVTSVDDLTADPEDVSIVMLDDWIISGSQMKSAYQVVANDPAISKYLERIEIQLVTSTQSRIDNGLTVVNNYGVGQNRVVPIRSYFRSHEAARKTVYTKDGHKAYETGSHSSVDYDYETSYISEMLTQINLMNGSLGKVQETMPAATRVVREYRSNPLLNIARLRASLDEGRDAKSKSFDVPQPVPGGVIW
jgi:hypothetical protein